MGFSLFLFENKKAEAAFFWYTQCMKYVIGLGNPGAEYEKTRHNIAWILFDALGLSGSWREDKYMKARYLGESFGKDIFLFIKPQTFMNNSGEVIPALKKQEDFSLNQLILVYDDLDLPFGEIKISFNRGDGGHKGLRSIIQHTKSREIIRIRIGISRLLDDGRLIKPNVLAPFPQTELSRLKTSIAQDFKKILIALDEEGLEKTMNIVNAKKQYG